MKLDNSIKANTITAQAAQILEHRELTEKFADGLWDFQSEFSSLYRFFEHKHLSLLVQLASHSRHQKLQKIQHLTLRVTFRIPVIKPTYHPYHLYHCSQPQTSGAKVLPPKITSARALKEWYNM
jgi:hypothetical protein